MRDRAGPDKDSDKRQRAVIAAFAKAHGYAIVDEFYAAAVSGADPIAESVKAMLDRVAGNGVRRSLCPRSDGAATAATGTALPFRCGAESPCLAHGLRSRITKRGLVGFKHAQDNSCPRCYRPGLDRLYGLAAV